MKFIKIYQHNGNDFYLINLANVTHVVVNQKAGSCLIHLTNSQQITCLPIQGHAVLTQISEYNRQLVEYMTLEPNTEDEF